MLGSLRACVQKFWQYTPRVCVPPPQSAEQAPHAVTDQVKMSQERWPHACTAGGMVVALHSAEAHQGVHVEVHARHLARLIAAAARHGARAPCAELPLVVADVAGGLSATLRGNGAADGRSARRSGVRHAVHRVEARGSASLRAVAARGAAL